ncbi:MULTISPECIES: hypothetical protein [Heyndrickxia]|uniref:Uncharacterized protein n=2 Tax=Heyndrickxia sporothermodurans TaxID=46224 RepID=A0A150LAJ0_9BACI|nr:hypothetical protein [Heyndrickxia sporothermodurans]KYD09230.1 hypothetical protein B4102_2496 [Heyndrickxia sporothermodurans]PTY78718.1 hypothetical protein B5V89_08165 [Heyndrickxia sporothermodurans]
MLLKDDVLLKLGELEQLVENLEDSLVIRCNNERKEIASKIHRSHLQLEKKIKMLEKKVSIKMNSTPKTINKFTYKLQNLG